MASTEVCLPAGPLIWSATRPRSPDGIPHSRPARRVRHRPTQGHHTVVAVDAVGRQVAQRTVAARTPQHLELIDWARAIADDRVWAVEDGRHVSRRLERDLLAVGERIVGVPPKLMAAIGTSIRSAGKSDPIDALAVARAALREPDLPVAQLDESARELKLLLDHREDLVVERTRVQNRLRWHLMSSTRTCRCQRAPWTRRAGWTRSAGGCAPSVARCRRCWWGSWPSWSIASAP
jgi:transposase